MITNEGRKRLDELLNEGDEESFVKVNVDDPNYNTAKVTHWKNKMKIFSGRNLEAVEEKINEFFSSTPIDLYNIKIKTDLIEKQSKPSGILYVVSIFYLTQEIDNDETKD